MLQRMLSAVGAVLLAGGLVYAGEGNQDNGCLNGSPVSADAVVTLTGTVYSTDCDSGKDIPTFVMITEPEGTPAIIVTGPYYLLIETGFSLEVGDAVAVTAFDCANLEETYIAITVVKNPDAEEPEVLELRDENGMPLWGSYGPQNGSGIGERDLATFSGTVTSADMTPEEGHATFTLDEEVTFVVRRYALIENDLVIAEGDTAVVVAFPSGQLENTFVAVEITINEGETIVLIDPNDRPRRPRFVRGDSNRSGQVDIGDAIDILNGLFGPGPRAACQDACDANDDGAVDLSDSVFILRHMFGGGRAMPAPYPNRGNDDTGDRLLCQQ